MHLLPNAAPVTPSIRPVQADDAPALNAFVIALAPQSRRWRFHGAVNACTPVWLQRMTQVDPRRERALVACLTCDDGALIVGEARCSFVRGEVAEFAIAVADAQHGSGLARRLLHALTLAARDAGVRELIGEVMDDNERMAAFLRREGYVPDLTDLFDDARTGVQRWRRTLVRPPLLWGSLSRWWMRRGVDVSVSA